MQRDNRTIRELAYHIWEQRGRPAGTAQEDWLEAERRLSAVEPVVAPKTSPKTSRRRTKDPRTKDPKRQAKPPPTPTPSSPRQ